MGFYAHNVSPSHAYFEALDRAEKRAQHSFFDQHVLEDDELGYIAIDEGDYDALPDDVLSLVVHTVRGAMSDEY